MELFVVPKTREAIERWQLVLRRTLERIGQMRLTGDSASEYFWTELRAAMLASGATELDIVQFAAYILCRSGNLAPERWLEQIEVIVDHLAARISRFATARITIRCSRFRTRTGIDLSCSSWCQTCTTC